MTNLTFDEKIEKLIWELHGQHMADYHMEFDGDIKNDLQPYIDQIKKLISETLGEVKPQNTYMRLSKYEEELRHAFNLKEE